MPLLSLKDIGKIYVSDGAVTVGLHGINLDFDIGEFVAVTGKSGSGKTTLLNMISGMDTYEEGELYIDGDPTSHYEQKDWELYRQKYISFIFQDYNIIDSFTVLQNVELALSYIDSPSERRTRALELVERVGLTRFKNHKGSKLSGGQKQRTVIARALAKDSPIILADEPTGNLDAKTSEEIIALLAEISHNKLVIVVTHSASELERYATREIRIFDGTVERDEELRQAQKNEKPIFKENPHKPHTLRRGLELGMHRFRAMPKLSFFMSMLMVLAILGTFFVTVTTTFDMTGDISAFDYRKGRIILSRQDGSIMSDGELEELANDLEAKTYSRYDHLYDTPITFSRQHAEGNRWENTTLWAYIDDGKATPNLGRAPQNSDEVMLVLPIGWKNVYGNELDTKLEIRLCGRLFKVCGIDYFYDNTKQSKAVFTEEGFKSCGDSSFLCQYFFGNVQATNEKILVSLPSYSNTLYFDIYVDDTLKEGECYISAIDYRLIDAIKGYGEIDVDFSWNKNSSNGMPSQAYIYSPDGFTVVGNKCFVEEPYNKYDDLGSGAANETVMSGAVNTNVTLYISPDMLSRVIENLRDPHYAQASLFFESDSRARSVAEQMREDGYYAVTSDHTFVSESERLLMIIASAFSIFGWVITLLFLSLFLYICSARAIVAKRGDIAILRSMGIEVKVIKVSMYAQTAVAMIPSFIVLLIASLVVYTSPTLNPLFPFMHAWQYAMIVIGMLIINIYISTKYNKKMFKDSVRKTLRGGGKE